MNEPQVKITQRITNQSECVVGRTPWHCNFLLGCSSVITGIIPSVCTAGALPQRKAKMKKCTRELFN